MPASANLAAAGSHIPAIPFEKYTLPNGLSASRMVNPVVGRP
jgi:hypothetical protein